MIAGSLSAFEPAFFRCTSSSDTAAGVIPGMREAWPSVAGTDLDQFLAHFVRQADHLVVIDLVRQSGFFMFATVALDLLLPGARGNPSNAPRFRSDRSICSPSSTCSFDAARGPVPTAVDTRPAGYELTSGCFSSSKALCSRAQRRPMPLQRSRRPDHADAR